MDKVGIKMEDYWRSVMEYGFTEEEKAKATKLKVIRIEKSIFAGYQAIIMKSIDGKTPVETRFVLPCSQFPLGAVSCTHNSCNKPQGQCYHMYRLLKEVLKRKIKM